MAQVNNSNFGLSAFSSGKKSFSSPVELARYVYEHPEDKDAYNLMMATPAASSAYNVMLAKDKLDDDGNWRDYNLAINSQPNIVVPGNTQDAINNMISNQNTEEARGFEQEMRDTSLTSAAEQLEQIGLSPSNVVQTGGLASNGVAAASVDKSNSGLQERMARFQQKMGVVKQVLSMTSQMAAAGIYGGSIGVARKAGSILASQAAHSGLGVFQNGWSGKGSGQKFDVDADGLLKI